ncbi:MAG: GNAT family N-acetyltransferase [Candidatus Hodarchaeota archaeon]
MNNLVVRKAIENDRNWVIQLIKDEWASTRIITRDIVHNIENLPGLIAVQDNERLGLLIYNIKNKECEIITLNSIIEGVGIGTALIYKLEEIATKKDCTRIWVITTNDNTDALRFYQMKGFKIKKIYIDAIKKSRELKPELPLLGMNYIEIRDEIELEKNL